MFPDIAVLTSGVDIFQKILSIRVLLFLDILVDSGIWGCNKLEARSSKKLLTCSDASKLNKSV